MNGVTITDIEVVKDDERGTTYQLENRDTQKMLFLKRVKGSVSGGHYHTGANPLKNPETLFLLEGTFEVHLTNVKTGEEETQTFDRPVLLKIDPYIAHTIVAKTNIIMMDMNSINDDDDTIKSTSLV